MTGPVHNLVPPQHGAWGFLVLPVVLGCSAGTWSVRLVPVVALWIALYPFSWALTNRLAARRAARFDRPLRVWSLVAAPLAVLSTAIWPWLVWVGVAYLLPFAANIAFAHRRRERSLANDAVLVAECVAAVPVIAGVGARTGGWVPPWAAMTTASVFLMALVCLLTLAGSTLHVKSLIRERANPVFTRAAQVFAVLSVPAVLGSSVLAGASWWLVLPFVALAARALWWHDPSWRPVRIGLVELAGFVAVAASAGLALS